MGLVVKVNGADTQPVNVFRTTRKKLTAAGRPENTVPVEEKQSVWVVILAVGVAGALGIAFTVSCNGEEIHPVLLSFAYTS